MNKNNRISSRLRLLAAALLALAAFSLSPLHAATTWNGGGGAGTTVANDLN